jgi:pyrroline-5-carboxylate reductase
MAETLSRLAAVPERERRRRCFVSIAAGIPIARLEKALGRGVPVLRVMPNTPALLRAGASAVSRGRSATAAHERAVKTILDAVGVSVSVPERLMDAVTALSGSGPAYAFYLTEAMTEAGQALGLTADLARTLARQTVYGAGLMLRARPDDAAELRRQVTSPGGTTAAAVAVFDREKLKKRIAAALKAAAKRSAELSRI